MDKMAEYGMLIDEKRESSVCRRMETISTLLANVGKDNWKKMHENKEKI